MNWTETPSCKVAQLGKIGSGHTTHIPHEITFQRKYLPVGSSQGVRHLAAQGTQNKKNGEKRELFAASIGWRWFDLGKCG